MAGDRGPLVHCRRMDEAEWRHLGTALPVDRQMRVWIVAQPWCMGRTWAEPSSSFTDPTVPHIRFFGVDILLLSILLEVDLRGTVDCSQKLARKNGKQWASRR